MLSPLSYFLCSSFPHEHMKVPEELHLLQWRSGWSSGGGAVVGRRRRWRRRRSCKTTLFLIFFLALCTLLSLLILFIYSKVFKNGSFVLDLNEKKKHKNYLFRFFNDPIRYCCMVRESVSGSSWDRGCCWLRLRDVGCARLDCGSCVAAVNFARFPFLCVQVLFIVLDGA